MAVVTTNGTPGNDEITTGADDDIINALGGTDIISSGDGNDTINPGDNNDFDFTDTGTGIDLVLLTDATSGFQALGFDSVPNGVTVEIDGAANTGTIDKGVSGTTTITDVQVPMLGDGFGIFGTSHDDVFTVRGVENGFAMMRGLGGNDTFNIVAGPGTVRLDYRATGATGIVADLGTGIVSEDGFGGTDTITGDPLDQIRGTNEGDTITGSDGDDHIRGEGGDDLITGGLGSDDLRGGDGNDTLNPGSNDGYDEVRAGLGDDNVILSDVNGGSVAIAHFDLEIGLQINIDGVANTGTVDKGAGGTTTLVDVQTAMSSSWFLIFGTFEDDTIRASAAEGGNVILRGYGGDDRFEFGGGPGRVRIDYDSSSTTRGIVANLGTGIVSEDGFGGTDTIIGTGFFELRGSSLNDSIIGSDGDDRVRMQAGDDTLDGGAGNDQAQFAGNFADATITQTASGDVQVVSEHGTDILRNVELLGFDDMAIAVEDLFPSGSEPIEGTPGPDVLTGTAGDDTISGLGDNDRLVAEDGNDSLDGGTGADTLNGGEGDDTIIGGPGDDDLRDQIFGGAGDDSIDAGAGNDLVFGQDGNDTIAGGAGVDELQGQDGDDVITGSNFSDLVFGGAGNDFVNGGFGHDRINGGSGADKFFHVGVEGHGSDWVQDYVAADGDVLLWGGGPATADDFQVNFAHTANDAGERAGDDAVQEAFVIYKPTGQIIWALVDGEGQSSINLQIGGDTFDLLG